MTMQFQKAARKQAKIRLGVSGPSGSGKTYGALLIAAGLGGRIAVIDTERGSASLYSDLVEFDTLELLPPFSPERFIEALDTAAKAGYDVCVIDSATHEWDGSGGCLDINEMIAHAKFKGNTWSAWSETTPRHRAFIDAMLHSPMHVIATMRSKTETVQGDDKKVKKLGMKAIQRDNTEYEFSAVLDIEHEHHYAMASKDRTGLFKEPVVITREVGARIKAWLDSGAVPKMDEGDLADHKAKMEEWISLDGLKIAFGVAWTAAKHIGDAAAQTSLQTKYEERKAVITAPVAAPNGAAVERAVQS